MIRRLAWLVSGVAVVALVAMPGCLDIGGEWKQGNGQGGNGGVLTGTSGALGGLGGDGGSAATGTFACDHHSLDSTCTTYAAGTSQSDAQASCDGTLLQTACPTVASVGRCQIGGETDVYYSDGATPQTAATAKQSCDFNGGLFGN